MVERAAESASDEELAGSAAQSGSDSESGSDAKEPATAKDAVVGWLTDFDAAPGPRRERRHDGRAAHRDTARARNSDATEDSAGDAAPEVTTPAAAVTPRAPAARVRLPGAHGGIRIRWSTLVAVLAGIGAAAIAVATVDPRFDSAPVPVASSPPAPEPTPSPSGTGSANAAESKVPVECGQFYSSRMKNRLRSHNLRLYSADSLAEASLSIPRGRSVGTGDSRLGRTLAGVTETECYWLGADDPRASGVLTAAGEGRSRQLQLARDRLERLGHTRLREDGGIRYFQETVDADGVPTGESHFFRDGVWFATQWYGYGPRGYSADMAATVLGSN